MSEWIAKINGQDFPARDLVMIRSWLREKRITEGSTIYDPTRGAWLSLLEFGTAHADSVILSTTPTLEGFRINAYLAVEAVVSAKFTVNIDKVREEALQLLRMRAVLHGGNAVVGIAFDYIWAADFLPTLTASGTVVQVTAI